MRAHAYAAWARAGVDSSFQPALDAVVALLPPPPLRLLDVGCGEGRVGAALIRLGYDIVGVDADATMAALAAEHHQARIADATSLPFAPQTFDGVVTVHALMEIADLDAAVMEMGRVARPGGVVVAVLEHPFSSGGRVARYSQTEDYAWDVTFKGVHIGLGGIHRPLERYVQAFERADLQLDSLREISIGAIDPLSLALRASRRII
jgi:ubiquinone/menaquinone biosynthesis C-methylase UbiE